MFEIKPGPLFHGSGLTIRFKFLSHSSLKLLSLDTDVTRHPFFSELHKTLGFETIFSLYTRPVLAQYFSLCNTF
jgi:hypothetical protein